MDYLTIPIKVPSELLLQLNETEEELKLEFQVALAVLLFYRKKLTIGKAVQFSGVSRYEFEKALTKYRIPISEIDVDQISFDVEKLTVL